jgi:hypothetical protein
MRLIRLIALSLLIGLFGSLVAPRASAQSADDTYDDSNAAAEAFKQAREKWNDKDYAAALPLFETALGDSGSPNARIYVARCLRELGRPLEAHEQMSRTLRESIELAQKEERYARTRDTAAAELALIESKLGKVIVVLDKKLEGASVTIAGRALAVERLGVPVAVEPGKLAIRASGAGDPVEQQLEIAAGQTKTVTLAPPDAPVVEPTTQPEPEGSDESSDFGLVRGLGIGVLALGVAGMVVFGITTVQADNSLAQLEDECGGARCTDEKYADVVDEGQTSETIANVSLVVGAVLLAGGAAMIIFGGPSEPEDTTATFGVTPEGGFFGVRGRF